MNLLGIIFVYAIYIWLQESVPEPERIAALRENTYVRVYGTVRSFGGKRNVTAFKMVPVMDMNEVTYHMLEVTHSHLALSKHAASVCLFCFLHFGGGLIKLNSLFWISDNCQFYYICTKIVL